MNDQVLICEYLDDIARLSLNRPRAMNALNGAVIDALETALDRVETDPVIRVLILTGAGAAFCAGADLKEALIEPTPVGKPDFLKRAGDLMSRLRNLPKPVIAAVNGTALAGGLELAMCADIIVAAEDAQLGDAHANYGVFPGAGGAAILPRLLPLPTSLYLLLTGRSLAAQRLYEIGFISELHPAERLQEAVLELARQIASKSPSALRRMKAVARESGDKALGDALIHEQVMLREHLRSEDLQEGLAAFAEKRAPRFVGR